MEFKPSIEWTDDEWPKTCRCGFVAEDEDAAIAHAFLKHIAEITEDAEVRE